MSKTSCVVLLLAMTLGFAPVSGQTPPQDKLGKLMVEKLRQAQRMFEGIVVRDYGKITKSAEELIKISNTAEWYVMRNPRYEMHSNEFRRAAEMVIQKAKDKNMDGVALSYVQLTLSCVRCHDYVREVRDVRLLTPSRDLALLTGP